MSSRQATRDIRVGVKRLFSAAILIRSGMVKDYDIIKNSATFDKVMTEKRLGCF